MSHLLPLRPITDRPRPHRQNRSPRGRVFRRPSPPISDDPQTPPAFLVLLLVGRPAHSLPVLNRDTKDLPVPCPQACSRNRLERKSVLKHPPLARRSQRRLPPSRTDRLADSAPNPWSWSAASVETIPQRTTINRQHLADSVNTETIGTEVFIGRRGSCPAADGDPSSGSIARQTNQRSSVRGDAATCPSYSVASPHGIERHA